MGFLDSFTVQLRVAGIQKARLSSTNFTGRNGLPVAPSEKAIMRVLGPRPALYPSNVYVLCSISAESFMLHVYKILNLSCLIWFYPVQSGSRALAARLPSPRPAAVEGSTHVGSSTPWATLCPFSMRTSWLPSFRISAAMSGPVCTVSLSTRIPLSAKAGLLATISQRFYGIGPAAFSFTRPVP